MNTVIQLQRDVNFSSLEEDLASLRLKPKQDYQLTFDYQDNEITIEFVNPMKASLWRVAVGYKYI
jgi:hypothetical protein